MTTLQPTPDHDAEGDEEPARLPARFPQLRVDQGAPRFSPEVPDPARVYAYWLGSKDHYPADRKAAEEVAACRPQVVAGARANRAFLARVVRYLARQQGIRQFLDIGPGMPAPLATHAVAQAIAPESKIVYVDSDPLVLAHARALLTSSREGVREYLDADLRDPEAIVKDAAQTLDFTRPAAVILQQPRLRECGQAGRGRRHLRRAQRPGRRLLLARRIVA